MKEGIDIYKALIEFQKKCPEISLDSEVAFKSVKFKYASLPHIIKTIRPIMASCGLGFTHLVSSNGVMCVLVHESGQSIQSEPFKLTSGTDPKDQGGAITYSKRYTLCAMLGICAEDDQDAPKSGKKIISSGAYDKVVERIEGGDLKAFINTLIHFELSEEQINKLFELSLFINTNSNG